MKTTVSIPDHIFERAERLASQGRRSRSEVYAAALDEYLARHAEDEVTDAINRVCGDVGGYDDAFFAAAGRRVLADTEW
ncbi:MAG: ribbon-helix-helix domain-containing protein [Gammaproteobacteria bacterium]|nr:ribbon-helix-helix domain-containing protein [Gammaproteobacteria bacterium]MDE0441619.1 ribbon-helix-helix domain-containing protein [Gammaproteobacteria bacterium]